MRKSVENLATSKLTGGRRHPLRTRKKYDTDRYPNEALSGAQETVTRKVRGKNTKSALKTIDFVNLATPNAKVICVDLDDKKLETVTFVFFAIIQK